MPHTVESQDYIADIFYKWKTYRRRSLIITLSSLVVCTIILAFIFYSLSSSTANPAPLFAILAANFAAIAASQYRIRKFVNSLSSTERELLSNSEEETYSHYGANAYEIVRESRRFSPPKELLRASQPAESDATLLRATQYTETTPQDQLLRPTENNAVE